MTTHADQTGFGMNEWLVNEKYQEFLADPQSVDPVWQEFFDGYQPGPDETPTPMPTVTPVDPESVTRAEQVAAVAPATTPAAAPATAPAAKPAAPVGPAPADESEAATLKGAAARTVTNMETSLHVPTATSVRAFPAKLLSDNRTVINRHLARGRGGKVSFTHLIGYAVVRALADVPVMNSSFAVSNGKPAVVTPGHVGLGLAIDLVNGEKRSLVVAAIRSADTMDFAGFLAAYEDIVRRARGGKLTADDFAGTTISLTNPGGIGTEHSIPRLMEGQGTIVGVGAMEYPAQFAGASSETLTDLGVSKTITLTSTYDHRVIQGAQIR